MWYLPLRQTKERVLGNLSKCAV